jgi:molybdenum cofactor biosynthesis enzyme MoaA
MRSKKDVTVDLMRCTDVMAAAGVGTITVRLVGDEPEIRRLLSRHLGWVRYTILEAGDGEEAADAQGGNL